MVFQVPLFWDVAIDGFQILLYLSILVFYIKNRLIGKKYAVIRKKIGTEQSFNTQVFNMTLQQQVNQAFANIVETLTAERNGLEGVLRLNSNSSAVKDIPNVPAGDLVTNHNDNHRISADPTGSARSRHAKVQKFCAKGLSARKISEELKISLGEVELILSLQEK